MIHIQEFLVNKKINKKIDQNVYKYFPKDKKELQEVIIQLLKSNQYDLNCIDVSNIRDFGYLFYNVRTSLHNMHLLNKLHLSKIDISLWNVSKAIDMRYMFDYCDFITNQDFSSWDVSNVENMSFMFNGCINFVGNGLDSWNTKSLKQASKMFIRCDSITDLNLGSWNTSNLQFTAYMFNLCKNFIGNGLEKWNVSNILNMEGMFMHCNNLNFDASKWRILATCNTSNWSYDCKLMTTYSKIIS
ncbi:MAG: BspA family leucine-rich repeat surface protein [Clostridia bacterium]|nr:BspA family leucine-rich repeat surface protein [Clostridia bacterium]